MPWLRWYELFFKYLICACEWVDRDEEWRGILCTRASGVYFRSIFNRHCSCHCLYLLLVTFYCASTLVKVLLWILSTPLKHKFWSFSLAQLARVLCGAGHYWEPFCEVQYMWYCICFLSFYKTVAQCKFGQREGFKECCVIIASVGEGLRFVGVR